jgi:hypothetical protein
MMSQSRNSQPFLKRHERWFTYASTIVLFGTFVVNEILRNESRDVADSVAHAETAYNQRNEMQQIASQVNQVHDWTVRILMKVDANKKQQTIWANQPELLQVLSSMREACSSAKSRFDNAMDLYDVLPYNIGLDEAHWRLKEAFRRCESNVEAAQNLEDSYLKGDRQSVEQVGKLLASETDGEMSDIRRFQTMFGSSGRLIHSLQDASDRFSELVFKEALAVRDQSKRRSIAWQYVSFGLYPFGLIIGFLGKIYGYDSSTVADS